MTSPDPTTTGAASPTDDGSVVQSPTGTPSSAPLPAETVTALQTALSAEQAAVWAYGLVAAYDKDDAAMVEQDRSGHLLRRDATAARLVAGGAAVTEPAPAYSTPVVPTDAASARQLAQAIEADAAAGWRLVLGSTDDAELRGFALTGLSDAAVRMAMWKKAAGAAPVTVPFPGQG